MNYDKEIVTQLNNIKNELTIHNGSNFCNICNENVIFRQFYYRKSALCPICHSLERHRAIAICLWYMLPNLLHKNILHFAPEKCLRGIITSIPNNYIGTNFSQTDKYNINIKEIPFDDNFFDLIIANNVLEHIDDDKKAVYELFRVLKFGGVALITVPQIWQYQSIIMRRTDGTFMEHLFNLDPDETYCLQNLQINKDNCLKYYGQIDHLRIYGKKSLCNLLQGPGFKVKIIDPKYYPKDFREKLNLIDDVFICTK